MAIDKIGSGIADVGYFLYIGLVDFDTVIKISSAIVLGTLMVIVKIQEYRLKKREIKLKDLEIKKHEKENPSTNKPIIHTRHN